MKLVGLLALELALTASVAAAQSANLSLTPEVFQVVELPIIITNPSLVNTKNGYLLKCSLSNTSEFRQLGLRYSLATIDATSGQTWILTRSEGFKLAPYQAKNVTFKTPLRLDLKGGERFVVMPEQVISNDYVWEVVQAKEALASYIAGDYSTTPRVLRVMNQVDAPIPLRILY